MNNTMKDQIIIHPTKKGHKAGTPWPADIAKVLEPLRERLRLIRERKNIEKEQREYSSRKPDEASVQKKT